MTSLLLFPLSVGTTCPTYAFRIQQANGHDHGCDCARLAQSRLILEARGCKRVSCNFDAFFCRTLLISWPLTTSNQHHKPTVPMIHLRSTCSRPQGNLFSDSKKLLLLPRRRINRLSAPLSCQNVLIGPAVRQNHYGLVARARNRLLNSSLLRPVSMAPCICFSASKNRRVRRS